MRLSKADVDRFTSKVIANEASGCFLWTAAIDFHGYGVFYCQGKMLRAHKVIYEHLYGPVKDGNILHHLCRVRHCVNPEHLSQIGIWEHYLTYKLPKGTDHWNGGKIHCSNNHLYTPDTLRIETDKYGQIRRRCRLCDKIKNDRRS